MLALPNRVGQSANEVASRNPKGALVYGYRKKNA
jgi:hypothetical protein